MCACHLQASLPRCFLPLGPALWGHIMAEKTLTSTPLRKEVTEVLQMQFKNVDQVPNCNEMRMLKMVFILELQGC